MAEAIGVASGLVSLAAFAFEASVTLYKTVESFRTYPERVHDLLQEVAALSGVLGPLQDTIAATDFDLSQLDIPLLECGKACKGFEEELTRCISRTTDGRTSFRDWARVRYRGDGIDEFRRLLAGYKLTISIALTDANLRTSSATTETLKGYNVLIQTAKERLEERLESIDGKLEGLIGRPTATDANPDAFELRRIEEERLSTQKCLQICAQLSEHISQLQSAARSSTSVSNSSDMSNLPGRVTDEGLEDCKNSLSLTAAKLERLMGEAMDRLVMKSRDVMASEEDYVNIERLRDEWQMVRQSMEVCRQAEINVKESVSIIENYATGDATQFMVSTNGQKIHGTNKGLGWRSKQVGGHMSDDTVQQISRDLVTIMVQTAEKSSAALPERTSSAHLDTTKNQPTTEYSDRYGQGHTLPSASRSTPATPLK